MDITLVGWTEEEQTVARVAFEQAYTRAVAGLIAAIKLQAVELSGAEAVWQLHDFISIQRHVIEGRFDFRFEGLLFTFASLIKEGLLQPEELQGLDAEKLGKITAMARF